MDIVRKITLILWILAGMLIMPPLLRSFGLKPAEIVKSFLAPSTSHPSSSQEKTSNENMALMEETLPVSNPDMHVQPLSQEEEMQPYDPEDEKAFNEMISGLEEISSVTTGADVEFLPTQVYRAADAAKKVRWAPPPPGFLTDDTFNYLIYREKNPVTPKIKTMLDTIHGNLMLDLTPFTIITKPSKILVMIFGKKESYMNFTKHPSWSGASSDLRSDSMYVIEGHGFYPLSVHELTHLYFDGYFLPTISPLWLSEGMAVYMQIHTTKEKPGWLDRSMRRIVQGDIIPLEEMTVTEDLSSLSTPQAELWYTQAYSLIDYLLNKHTRDEFYKFCNELKAKTPLHQALYRAYGMPFNKVSVLQNVWLHELQRAYKAGEILLDRPAKKTPEKKSAALPPSKPSQAKPAGKTPHKKGPSPSPKKTKINKLEMVPTNGYKGGF